MCQPGVEVSPQEVPGQYQPGDPEGHRVSDFLAASDDTRHEPAGDSGDEVHEQGEHQVPRAVWRLVLAEPDGQQEPHRDGSAHHGNPPRQHRPHAPPHPQPHVYPSRRSRAAYLESFRRAPFTALLWFHSRPTRRPGNHAFCRDLPVLRLRLLNLGMLWHKRPNPSEHLFQGFGSRLDALVLLLLHALTPSGLVHRRFGGLDHLGTPG